ncbi:hypothetical protein LSH36_31g03008 [Paralvinella palmiformis]|uniref:RNase H type-1 domain-containing protein n=1 Tax=Paralvinella palmiformis TaxID=53620 RepID=A0AAD9NEE3_9ANNE|nr:hypothetical protein LSH36_31g03008 [Paralvinella palmiformis]
MVCDRQYMIERLPDVASIYTAVHHRIGSTGDKLIICVDSVSCLQTIENLDIENPLVLSILELHSTFKTLQKDVVFCWVPSHVGIRDNELADKAAKTALKGRKINIPLPFTDFLSIIKQYVRKQWSDFWSLQSEKKVHAVQPALGCSVWSCRERCPEEIVLCRLWIGNSFLTHRYLLAGEDPPGCISCQERLTMMMIDVLRPLLCTSHIEEKSFCKPNQISVTVVRIPGDEKIKESIWVELKMQAKDTLLIGVMYRSPSCSLENHDYLRTLIWNATKIGTSHLLIMGYFNYGDIN